MFQWKNISRTKIGLSAGRCQTPALRIIYENQKEIDNLELELRLQQSP